MMARGIAVNAYKVQAKQWKKWTGRQRQVFNDVHFAMASQSVFIHPKQPPMDDAHWQTIRWNAAFTAAQESGP